MSDYNKWLSADYTSLNKSELKQGIKALARTANQRIYRLRESGVYSPALRNVNNNGKFGVMGKKTDYELRSEFLRVQRFLSSKTSTVTGARKYNVEIYERLGMNPNQYTQEDLQNFWDVYNEIKDNEGSNAFYTLGSERLQELIVEYRDAGKSYDDIMQNINDYADRKKEESEREYEELSGAENFFNLFRTD